MKKQSKLLMVLIINFSVIIGAKAYEHEVWKSGSQYYWKTFNVTRGHSSDLATAIQGAISSGNRTLHITCSGTLSSIIELKDGLTLRCHNNSFGRSHSGNGFHGNYVDNVKIYDMSITSGSGSGIWCTGCNNLTFQNVKILAGSIGMRIESKSGDPWNAWISNLTVQDCRFENCNEHGLETYSVNGLSVYGIVCRNNGGCGVLFNRSKNGSVGTVNSYRCCYGGGYAGLRFANDCDNITVSKCISDKCGRGLFILTGSKNITVNCCEITSCSDVGIWLENVSNCKVKSGCCNCGVAVSGSGSYASVQDYCSGFSCNSSSSSSSSSGDSYYRLKNRATSLYLDGMGRTSNGSDVGQWSNTSSTNAQWKLESTGSYYKLKNRSTGLYLDGMGRTSNGSACGQWSSSSSYNQQWERISTSGYYRFKNRATGLYLDGMGRTSNGSDCGQWANTSSSNAQWSLISMSSAEAEAGVASDESIGKIFPTTVENILKIKLSEEMENGSSLRVYNSTGKLVYSTQLLNKDNSINLSTLSNGIYFVNVSNGKKDLNHKIIKK